MEVNFEVIRRYLDNKGTSDDKEQIVNWFASLEAERDLRIKYKKYWDELNDKLEHEIVADPVILGRIYHEIKLDESASERRIRPISRIIGMVTRIAAVLFIPLMVFLYLNRHKIVSAGGKEVLSEIHALPGTRAMFYLPDGSTGWLNGDSRLEFPNEFTGKSREVVLEGEAYFNVRTNPNKPFIVDCETVQIAAYGTEFNVLAYPGDRIIEVTNVSGNVRVTGMKEDIEQGFKLLEEGQMCILDRYNYSCQTVPVNAEEIISWKEGKLVFRDELFRDVIKKMNRWYNVNITIKDKNLETYQYRATFEDETLEEVLKLLKISAPIDYKDMGRKRRDDGSFEKREILIYYKP
jgi:ferric-dicitrate binding protein FerR (iron transport regulator)